MSTKRNGEKNAGYNMKRQETSIMIRGQTKVKDI